MKRPFKLFGLVACGAFLLLGLLSSTGCKPKKVELPPTPVPTPTPMPPGSVVFAQRGHLTRLDLDSSQTTPLTSGKSSEWFPACSPLGDQVAYWSNAESGVYNLWKINLDGSNRVQLTFDEADSLRINDKNLLINDSPGWSADGKKIIYSVAGEIWSIDSDGFNPETLLTAYGALCPSFSPDGKSILFISLGPDQVYNLWTMNLTDRLPKKLTNYVDWNVGSPSYSSDGRKIIFNLYRQNQTQVYTTEPDGSNPVNITNNDRSLCPRFAQYDKKIIFCSYGTGEDVNLTVFMSGINGTDQKSIADQNAASPSWAPGHSYAGIAAPVSTSTSSTIPLPTPVGK